MKQGKPKNYGVHMSGESFKPESTMSLEGEHATTMKAQTIGKKVQMVVTGTKTRHSMNGDGSHSASFKIHKVKISDTKETAGPNKAGAKNDEDGTEAAQ